MLSLNPRIALIHALAVSEPPVLAAFARLWPDAQVFSLLDDSLAGDLSAEGTLTPGMVNRFRTLGRYAADCGANGKRTDAILFTCNAFGLAIEQVKRDLSIPVLKPNEAAFERALEIGPRIGLLATFESALPSVLPELQAMAAARRVNAVIETAFVPGALRALKAGDSEEHDRLIARSAASLPKCDAIVLSQFSMARAAPSVAAKTASAVLTTPEAAVEKLRALVAGSPK